MAAARNRSQRKKPEKRSEPWSEDRSPGRVWPSMDRVRLDWEARGRMGDPGAAEASLEEPERTRLLYRRLAWEVLDAMAPGEGPGDEARAATVVASFAEVRLGLGKKPPYWVGGGTDAF